MSRLVSLLIDGGRMKKVVLGCMVAMFAMVFAAPALASSSGDPEGGTGWMELCKYADTAGPVTGPFSFTVTDASESSQRLTVQTGTCTAPFQLASGTATVVEDAVPFATVTGISTIPADRLVSSDLPSGTANVTIVPGDISTTTTVNYTNKKVTGFIEVCKRAAPGTGLTGNFQFTITGAMGFTDTVSVPVGACSDSIQVPAGPVKVQETGTRATYVVDITVQGGEGALPPGPDLANATVTVGVVPGDVSTETIVTFTDSPSVLKICKVAGDDSLLGENFPFTANGTSLTVPAGAPPGGTCEIVPGIFTAGTTVDIAEGIVPGTEVSSITVDPPDRVVPDSIDTSSRTVSVVLGSGETVVTYTNVPAPPGTLKICKNAGPGVTAGSIWTFTVSNVSGTVAVPAGSCTIVPGPADGGFPFNSTQTITETPVSGFAVTAIAGDPADRLVSSDLATGTATVTIGSGVTETTTTASTTTTTSTGTPTTVTLASGNHPGSSPTSGTTSGGTTSGGGTIGVVIHGRVMIARVVMRHGQHYLLLKVVSKAKKVRVQLTELAHNGTIVRRRTVLVSAGSKQLVKLPYTSAVRSVKVAVVS
jgi:hypothetical protein